MKSFGKRMKSLRKEKGKTLQEMADDLHTTKATLSRYENDHNQPKIDFLKQIADYLNTTVDYLIGRTNRRYEISKDNLPEQIQELIENNDIRYIEAIKEAKKRGLSPKAVKAIIETISDLDIDQ